MTVLGTDPATEYRHPLRFHIALGALVVIGGSLAGLVIAQLLDRQPPREDISWHLEQTAYKPGEFLRGSWRLTYLRACPAHAIRWLTSKVDPSVIAYLPSEDIPGRNSPPTALPAIVQVAMAPFPIPPMPPGPAYYHLRVEFACNELQRTIPATSIAVDFPVVELEILPP